jgi:hypothetical protein
VLWLWGELKAQIHPLFLIHEPAGSVVGEYRGVDSIKFPVEDDLVLGGDLHPVPAFRV